MGNTAYSISRIAHNRSFMRDVPFRPIHTDGDRTMTENSRIRAPQRPWLAETLNIPMCPFLSGAHHASRTRLE